MTETYIHITPMSYRMLQRVEASTAATNLGAGLHMAVGNSTTRFYADTDVPIGKVRITMPLEYKGIPEYIKTLDDPEDDWCPREADHVDGAACLWCEREPSHVRTGGES